MFCSVLTANNSQASSDYLGYVGNEISIYYSGDDCLEETSSSAKVRIGGEEVDIENWWQCSGRIDIVITANVNHSGTIKVYRHDSVIEEAGYFELIKDPRIYSVNPKYIVPGETLIEVSGNYFGEDFYDDTLYVTGENQEKVEIERVVEWSDDSIKFYAPSNMGAGNVYVRKYANYNYTEFDESDYYYIKPQG